MKDLGKNTVKPQITNVILYIQTHENCETKFELEWRWLTRWNTELGDNVLLHASQPVKPKKGTVNLKVAIEN